MNLDPQTLLVVNVVNQLVLASTLPIIMGRRLSPAARNARLSLVVQGAGWMALLLSGLWSGSWLDWLLSTVSMVCISASQWLLFQAIKGWLGPRPLERTLAVIAIAMPLGYALTFGSYPLRVGWSNLLIAMQSLVIARAALFPASALSGRWRWVLFASLSSMAVLTAIRGVLGAFFTELYPSFEAPNPFNIAALLVANVTLVLANVAVLVAWHEEADQQMRAQAVTDQLTGLLNRRGWTEQVSVMNAQALRHEFPLALLAIDLDFFKTINDTRGHDAGDAALELFGRVLKRCKRASDLAARMGGEEFCILLPFCNAEAARAFDQRLRTELAGATGELGHELGFSSGLAVQRAQGESVESLMSRADAALYRAKNQGRGRLISTDLEPAPAST